MKLAREEKDGVAFYFNVFPQGAKELVNDFTRSRCEAAYQLRQPEIDALQARIAGLQDKLQDVVRQDHALITEARQEGRRDVVKWVRSHSWSTEDERKKVEGEWLACLKEWGLG